MLGLLVLLGTLIAWCDCQNATTVQAPCADPAAATVCPDENAELCSVIDPPTTGSPMMVDSKCTNKNFDIITSACSKRCGRCCKLPAYSCSNKPNTLVNCTQLGESGFCTGNSSLHEIVAKECPQTCGLCATSGSACSDSDPDLCAQLGNASCLHKDYYQMMSDLCQMTCNTCKETSVTTTAGAGTTVAGTTTTTQAAGQCVDIASNCGVNTGLCSLASYKDLMSSKCKSTCNYCGGQAPPVDVPSTSCVDNHNSCPTWVSNGFCSSAAYTPTDKKKYCPKSCNLCN